MNTTDSLLTNFQRIPHQAAIIQDEYVLTWSELHGSVVLFVDSKNWPTIENISAIKLNSTYLDMGR